MKNKIALLVFLILMATLAYGQDREVTPFFHSGGSESDEIDVLPGPLIDPKADLDPVWLYVSTKADELESHGEITHADGELADETKLRLSELILEYDKRFYDHEIDQRISRMCETYQSSLTGLDSEQSAAKALEHMETGDQLRSRRRGVSRDFLESVTEALGLDNTAAVLREADIQASFISSYSIDTTRDWIEKMNLDKVAYVNRACGL